MLLSFAIFLLHCHLLLVFTIIIVIIVTHYTITIALLLHYRQISSTLLFTMNWIFWFITVKIPLQTSLRTSADTATPYNQKHSEDPK